MHDIKVIIRMVPITRLDQMLRRCVGREVVASLPTGVQCLVDWLPQEYLQNGEVNHRRASFATPSLILSCDNNNNHLANKLGYISRYLKYTASLT